MPNALPPGPRTALAQLPYMQDPFPYMLKLAAEFSDPVTCPILGGPPMVLTWSPEGLRALFTADPATFSPGSSEALAIIVGRGSLFLKSGEEHKRARKLLLPPFHGERMRAYGALMRETSQRWLERAPVGEAAPMLPTAQGITLDIIIEAIFGERDPERITALHRDILATVAAFNPIIAMFPAAQREFGGFGPWAKFKRRSEALNARMLALMEEKRQTPGEDILSLLVSARYDDGEPLPDQEVLEQLLTFVIAGHETTATSLSWAFYELLRAPEALERLSAEIAGVDTPEALTKLPFLDAVASETLRMHPPVPVVLRKLNRSLELGGYTLPEGTSVGAAVYTAHCREESFPEPMRFRPERFLERHFSPFEFLPFGGGARRCLGAAFASTELRIALATLLQGGQWQLAEPKPVTNAFRIGTYGPKTGVRVKLLERR